MKKNLLLFCCGLLSLSVSAQMPYVATPTMIPQNPTSASFIKIATKVTTPNQGIIVDVNTFMVTGQQIMIKGCYWQGMATATQDFVDTLMIGQLPAGNYQLSQKAYLSSTQQHCTKTDSNMAATPLVINVTTGVNEQFKEQNIAVTYDPSSQALYFFSITRVSEAYIFSVNGSLIRKIDVAENKPAKIQELSNGVYYIRFKEGNKAIKFVKYSE